MTKNISLRTCKQLMLIIVSFGLISCGSSTGGGDNNTTVENHAPVAKEQAVTVVENSTNNLITLLGSDEDGDSLTYSIETEPTHGTLTLSDNIAKYTPSLNYSGSDSFTFKTNDKSIDSDAASVSITVTEKVVISTGKAWDHGDLKVSDDKHMLQHEDGTPFFYLADTAWFIASKLSREEIDKYLTDRAEKGFSVVMVNVMSLAWERNAYGDIPFPIEWAANDTDENGTEIPGTADNREAYKIDQIITTEGNSLPTEQYDPSREKIDIWVSEGKGYLERNAYLKKFEEDEYDYWDHVAYIVDKAAEKGLYVGMFITWGGDVNNYIAEDETIYRKYVKDLTTLFKDRKNLIWVTGGDVYQKDTLMKEPQWNWIGEELKANDSSHLVSFHGNPSSHVFQETAWLDFNMVESAHKVDDLAGQNRLIMNDYVKTPAKPTIDAETRYEDISVDRDRTHFITPREVREIQYYQLFSGAFGITYGHSAIWQVATQEKVDTPISEITGYARIDHPRMTWEEALDSPGAFQMQYLGELMESRPVLGRVPDQSLIVSRTFDAKATRGDGYAMVYSLTGEDLDIRLGKVSGSKVNIWSFNPRTGEAKALETSYDNSGVYTFVPDDGEDWIVVIDDASKNYEAPGTKNLLVD